MKKFIPFSFRTIKKIYNTYKISKKLKKIYKEDEIVEKLSYITNIEFEIIINYCLWILLIITY